MFEADLRDLLSDQITVLENGLTLVQKESFIPNAFGTRSFIDLLAQDSDGRWVLVELKRSDAAAREAIHEIYKYVEGVKGHLRARDDEIRTLIVSTEWKELLVPFSRFVHDTTISVKGLLIEVGPSNQLLSTPIEPLSITSGRVLSPWHEISLYRSEERLQEGIKSYDASCTAKGISDYLLVIMTAPEGFYEHSVVATANALASMGDEPHEANEAEIEAVSQKMDRMDWMIYFVPQLLTADAYLKIIESDPAVFEEVSEFIDSLEGEEALSSLQEHALYADPKVDRDYFEIGYPAKFKSKLLETEGWTIETIHRRGAFARNQALSDTTIIGEIAGEAGTSGQRFKRSVQLDDKAAVSSALKDINECLVNNPAWAAQISGQLDEARRDFPDASADISVFSPSTGVFTIFFTTTREDGASYIPTYSMQIIDEGLVRRIYAGELIEANDIEVAPDAFTGILTKYYGGQLGSLVMSMTWGAYEHRDAEILYDLNLDYTTFRCDLVGEDRIFYRMSNNRWRKVGRIDLFQAYQTYLERNERLVSIVDGKLLPRVRPPLWDGSPAKVQLEALVDPIFVEKGKHYICPPDACDLCRSPLSFEPFMSDAKIKGHAAWANLCTDCTVYHAAGFGIGVGQLYRNEGDSRWLLVAGGFQAEEEVAE